MEQIEDTKKHGHPGNQFNRQAPEGEEGYNFGVSITWKERAILKQSLVQQGKEPTKEMISKSARKLMKETIAAVEQDEDISLRDFLSRFFSSLD